MSILGDCSVGDGVQVLFDRTQSDEGFDPTAEGVPGCDRVQCARDLVYVAADGSKLSEQRGIDSGDATQGFRSPLRRRQPGDPRMLGVDTMSNPIAEREPRCHCLAPPAVGYALGQTHRHRFREWLRCLTWSCHGVAFPGVRRGAGGTPRQPRKQDGNGVLFAGRLAALSAHAIPGLLL